jgi:hypothetical protein
MVEVSLSDMIETCFLIEIDIQEIRIISKSFKWFLFGKTVPGSVDPSYLYVLLFTLLRWLAIGDVILQYTRPRHTTKEVVCPCVQGSDAGSRGAPT